MPQFGTAGHGERSRSTSTANSTTGEEIAFSLHTLTDENSKLIAAYLQVIPNQHLICKPRNAKQPTSSLRRRVMDAPEAKSLIRMAMAWPIIPKPARGIYAQPATFYPPLFESSPRRLPVRQNFSQLEHRLTGWLTLPMHNQGT